MISGEAETIAHDFAATAAAADALERGRENWSGRVVIAKSGHRRHAMVAADRDVRNSRNL